MNTYTMREIKKALEKTYNILYPEAYIGHPTFECSYDWLRNNLVQQRRYSLLKVKKRR